MQENSNFQLNCPLPMDKYSHILLGHGSGGKLMRELINNMFLATFQDKNYIEHDSAVLNLSSKKIAFTTDSYVVNPLFFPGGDIGSMAVYGTVNDLAMSGAIPLYLSLSFILEEGLEIATLWRIIQSIKKASEISSVKIVTGDTKVVEKGKGDQIFINTSGIGIINHNLDINPHSIKSNDMVILSGDIGQHGIAIMAIREGLEFETSIKSDSAPVTKIILDLINAGIKINCLRDLTRGGLASALNEIAFSANIEITINENAIDVQEEVKGACEILGFDPLYVANEGRFIMFISEEDVDKSLTILKAENSSANIIGKVKKSKNSMVILNSKIGGKRVINLLSGEQLPRIC
ncbi:[NiFe] hydrogenase metallocenter assembly protein HypE [Geminocystis sp. NIES-3708]|uniref:hydrogenase expression/formation protein HypE n=1 Tax=Geminocystis sp. NIES-3708 TaxID=1615909 RepID=UPI0005FCA67C|nr:hydrogenase expression/formation protein HypE [Geminocystis sp. NIES-3708]BAQ62165.1 [NiFe] hydrogenase metallocenter assembly protein HypE [Geminocystis sp. NIES-3708]